MLVDMGLRVVAPDCLGYGRTVISLRACGPNTELNREIVQEAPDDYPEYSNKRCADDMKALAFHLGESKIILGGHDW